MNPINRSQKQIIARIAGRVGSGAGRSSAGDLLAGEKFSTVSLNAINNLIPSNGRTFSNLGGSVVAQDRHFICATGTTQFAYGALQSFRSITYREGQAASVRFGVRFDGGIALTWMGCGLLSIGDEVSFGYNGVDFGVWHRYGGLAEVQTLTVTGAAGGSENATLTIDGVAYTIPLTATTVAGNASEIATYIQDNSTTWAADQLEDTVILSCLSDGDKTGTFSFSSATATGTLVETTQGVTKTSDFVQQSDFNGVLPNGFDPSLGNNYEIKFSNGYGRIEYYIDDMELGYPSLVHTVKWGNSTTEANFGNPSMRAGGYAYSIGATTNVEAHIAYITAFIDGKISRTRNPRSFNNTKSIATTETNILTIRNRRTYNGLVNQSQVLPTKVFLANDGIKNAIFHIRTNPTIGGTTNFQPAGTNLLIDCDTAGTTSTGGRLLDSIPIAKGQGAMVDLSAVTLPPSITLSISGNFVSGSANVLSASIQWYEDI